MSRQDDVAFQAWMRDWHRGIGGVPPGGLYSGDTVRAAFHAHDDALAERDALREWVRDYGETYVKGVGNVCSECTRNIDGGINGDTHAPDCSVPSLLGAPSRDLQEEG